MHVKHRKKDKIKNHEPLNQEIIPYRKSDSFCQSVVIELSHENLAHPIFLFKTHGSKIDPINGNQRIE